MLGGNGGSEKVRIAAIGGGTGLSALLRGLKPRASEIDIVAIVTTFDDGGSSGLLRREFGYPGLGDLRQCLLALASEEGDASVLADVLEFRFPENSALAGHSLGNLLLAGLLSKSGYLSTAIEEASRLLRIQGRVLPVSLESGHLCAELHDGHIIYSESAIDLRDAADPGISRIFLRHPVPANPVAMEAVLNADVIVLGPGDLFTSILPNVLPDGMKEAICGSRGKIIFACNLTTKQGETDGFKASDFVATVNDYLDPEGLGSTASRLIDTVIVNQCDETTAEKISGNDYGESPVLIDDENLYGLVDDVLVESLLGGVNPARHEPDALVDAVVKAARSVSM